MKRHVVAQPAFNSAPFVVIAPGALHSILITALKSIDIELAHIVPDPFKAPINTYYSTQSVLL